MKINERRFIMNNDGGTLVGPSMETPLGTEGLVRLTIDPLRDTQINTLYWTLGTDPYMGWEYHRLSDIYSHSTKLGTRWGVDRDKFETAGLWRIYNNTQDLIDKGTDPPKVVIEYGHKAGLEVFLSMRINDTHDGRIQD